MRKTLQGDTFIVVIDEIGEITFSREVLFGKTNIYNNKETTERVLAAVVELLEVVAGVLPVCAADFEVRKALELLLRDFGPLRDRLAEQWEFSDTTPQG